MVRHYRSALVRNAVSLLLLLMPQVGRRRVLRMLVRIANRARRPFRGQWLPLGEVRGLWLERFELPAEEAAAPQERVFHAPPGWELVAVETPQAAPQAAKPTARSRPKCEQERLRLKPAKRSARHRAALVEQARSRLAVGFSFKATARQLDVSESTLRAWFKREKAHA